MTSQLPQKPPILTLPTAVPTAPSASARPSAPLPVHRLPRRADHDWRIEHLWQQANVPPELATRRLGAWPFDTQSRDYLSTWLDEWQQGKRPSLVLIGRARSGKTGIVVALAYELLTWQVEQETPCFSLKFTTAYDLMALLGGYQGREERFKQFLNCDLLILDDLGREPAWDSSMANLTRIVMHRYNYQLPIMLTSNLSFGEIETRFGRDGDAVTGRLREMARGFVVEGFGE